MLYKLTRRLLPWDGTWTWADPIAGDVEFNDVLAQLWVNNVNNAIEVLDSKTDQIDEVWAINYTSYINAII